jgi:hypothetical protein
MIAIENAFTKCPFCGIIYPLVPPAGERRHDDTDPVFRGCNAPMSNPRNPDDPNGCFTCFSCNITEGFGSTGKKIKRRFSRHQRRKGALARCKSCVSAGRVHQFPTFQEECRDNSDGTKLRKAIHGGDADLPSLLIAGANPNAAPQAWIDDTYAEHFLSSAKRGRKLLWNPNGSIVHDICQRPLSHVMSIYEDPGGIYYDVYYYCWRAIARVLIDAGASLSPTIDLLRLEGFTSEEGYSAWPATVTLRRAQNAIRQLLEQCQKHDHFDFGVYFQEQNKDCFPLTPREIYLESRAREEDEDCFALTEKAVQASSELLPFYYAYAERRAIARLQSHRSSLFSGRQRQDGEFLPALPTEIEARIRSLALLSAENPILASQIPDPIAQDSDPIAQDSD